MPRDPRRMAARGRGGSTTAAAPGAASLEVITASSLLTRSARRWRHGRSLSLSWSRAKPGMWCGSGGDIRQIDGFAHPQWTAIMLPHFGEQTPKSGLGRDQSKSGCIPGREISALVCDPPIWSRRASSRQHEGFPPFRGKRPTGGGSRFEPITDTQVGRSV